MTISLQQIRAIALTLVAVAIAYGLWIAAAHAEEWVGAPELMPIVRIGVIVIGLSAAEWIHRRLVRH